MKTPRVGLVLMLSAQAASAQSSDSALVRVAEGLRPGTTIRVELLGRQRASGVLQGVGPHGLEISGADGSRLMALQDVTRLWQRKRAVAAGGIIGGVIGAGVGGFFGLIATALCEYDCSSPAAGLAIGGLIGAGLGGGTGMIIGAAIPRWSTVYRRDGRAGGDRGDGGDGSDAPRRPVAMDAPSPRRYIGEVSIMAVAGAGGYEGNQPLNVTEDRGAVFGGEIGLAFRAGPISLGPEYRMLRGEHRMWTLGGMIRYGLDAERGANPERTVPHIAAGLGAFNWQTDMIHHTVFTGTIGAGVTLPSGWRFEARWHPTLHNIDPKPALFTVGAGYRFTW